MNIAHVFSSDFFSGSVAYVVSIAKMQIANGHNVFLITDNTISQLEAHCIKTPIADRTYANRIKNIRCIRNVIKENNIQLVHAHSRAASWVSYYAVKKYNIPLVSTIHGIQSKAKKVNLKKVDVYGDQIICICKNLSEQLIKDVGLAKEKISVIHNGIDCNKFINASDTIAAGKYIISIIGRFNGPKGANFSVFICDVLPVLLEKYDFVEIKLVGPKWEDLPEAGKQAFDQLSSIYKDRITRIDYTDDVKGIMLASDLIIGGGRVAIEALLLQKTLFAIGEAEMIGITTEKNINQAIDSNFGDIKYGIRSFHPDAKFAIDEIENQIAQRSMIDLRSIVEEQYSLENTYQEIEKIYQHAIIRKIHPYSIPILMYHKIVNQPIDSQHKIFVTTQNFEKHLQFFKRRGMQSITFKEYWAFSKGEIPAYQFPKKPIILTFDDGYTNNLTNALPLCNKYGYKAVLFLLGDEKIVHNQWDVEDIHLAENAIMTMEQKKDMVAAGWEIGGHTLSHPHLSDISYEQAFNEIALSKQKLSEMLNTEVITFAYPYGKYEQKHVAMAKDAGYQFAVSTDSGGMHIEEDRWQIFRVNIFPHENTFSLFKKTSKWYRSYYKRKKGK